MENIIQPLDNAFQVNPELAFLTDSLMHLTAVKLQKKFDQNIALDTVIFANQSTVFCLSFGIHDSIKLFPLLEFQEMIASVFSQTVSPQVQKYDQILVIKDGILQFASIHTKDVFLARNTTKLNHVHKMIQKIVFKEKQLIDNLDSFIKMLQQSNILKQPESRKRRSFFDIFSTFSLESVANVANKNYEAMNSNFRHIQSVSKIMQTNQKMAITQMNDISSKEKMIYRKSLFLEFSSLTNSIFSNYIFNLQTILENIKLSPVLDISFISFQAEVLRYFLL